MAVSRLRIEQAAHAANDHPRVPGEWPAALSTMHYDSGWRYSMDSVNPDAVRRALATGTFNHIDMVIGYPDFGWTDADFASFEDAGYIVARITQRDPGDILKCSIGDYEPGAMSKLGLRGFIVGRNGFRPGTASGYSDLNNLPSMGQVLAGLHYWVWCAQWPAYPTAAEVSQIRAMRRPGTRLAAIQYRNVALADVDLSVVLDPDWHRS